MAAVPAVEHGIPADVAYGSAAECQDVRRLWRMIRC